MRCGPVLLAVWWFVGVVGCGPGASREPGLPTAATNGPVEDHRRVMPVSPPASVPSALTPSLSAPPSTQKRVVPEWIATALNSPDIQVRLHALDRWGQAAPAGSVDPLVQALEDKDEQVQARALELIVQDWARARAAKPLAGQGREASGEGR